MITLINGSERNEFSFIVNEMHKIRAQVFRDRLMWDVSVENGLERDEFDDENPLYLVSVDENSGIVQGSLRLLPTTGPNMLRDVFPILLEDGNVVESANIWEVSRFAISGAKTQLCDGRTTGRNRRSWPDIWAFRSSRCF